MVGGLVLVGLLVAAVVAAVAAGLGWFVSTVRAPVDVANTYFVQARDGDVPAATCAGADPPNTHVWTSTAQDLHQVDVTGRHAEVRGTITLDGGERRDVTVGLEQEDGGWCVAEVRVGQL